jgi:hypothetical protein
VFWWGGGGERVLATGRAGEERGREGERSVELKK